MKTDRTMKVPTVEVEIPHVTTQNTTTACVPSFFCPRSRQTSEVVVRKASGSDFSKYLSLYTKHIAISIEVRNISSNIDFEPTIKAMIVICEFLYSLKRSSKSHDNL